MNSHMARTLVLAGCIALASTALAFDGWRLESTTIIDSEPSAWDYLTLDASGGRLFIGHRKAGLQVYDIAGRKIVATIAQTASASSNGATLMPEFDLGISNNEDGSITPFSLSTLQVREPIKLAAELDTSHYDPVTRRILVNVAPGKEGSELVVLQAPGLEKIGTVKVRTRKPEHAEADGSGFLYMATRDLDTVVKIDMKTLSVVAEWPAPGCGQTNSLALDTANRRIFLGCRGNAQTKPAFAVMNMETGTVIYTSEVGGGNDGIAYDAQTQRLYRISEHRPNAHVTIRKRSRGHQNENISK